jgi:hypothetical protein
MLDIIGDLEKLSKQANLDFERLNRSRYVQESIGKSTLVKVKRMRTVSEDLKLALQRRHEQLRNRAEENADNDDMDWSLHEQEEIVWKNIAGHIKICQLQLFQMRQELLEYDTEQEPNHGVLKTTAMRLKITLLHKDILKKLNADLDDSLRALQVNLHSITV